MWYDGVTICLATYYLWYVYYSRGNIMWCDGVTMYLPIGYIVNRTCSQSRQVSSYDNGMS